MMGNPPRCHDGTCRTSGHTCGIDSRMLSPFDRIRPTHSVAHHSTLPPGTGADVDGLGWDAPSEDQKIPVEFATSFESEALDSVCPLTA